MIASLPILPPAQAISPTEHDMWMAVVESCIREGEEAARNGIYFNALLYGNSYMAAAYMSGYHRQMEDFRRPRIRGWLRAAEIIKKRTD